MISSMTGFASRHIQGEWGRAAWELRSVNHRYLEPFFRMPEACRAWEMELRQLLAAKLQRGKVDISLRFTPGAALGVDLAFNQPLAQALVTLHADLEAKFSIPRDLNTQRIVSWPGMVEVGQMDISQAQTDVFKAFDAAIDDLLQQRQREGAALSEIINTRLDAMLPHISQVEKVMPEIIEQRRIKLQEKLADVSERFDADRLEQEMVLFAQKIDVDEELDRLKTHIKAIKRTLQKGGLAGRRLDFQMQELNREANTLASKSNSTVTTQAAVELKVLIEQMREQVQNIE